jgi:hypothetical protein
LRLRGAAGDFEDLVHFFDEEFVFGVGEIAVHVELLELGGDGGGAGFAILFEVGGFATGAGEGVDQAGEGAGDNLGFIIGAGGFEAAQGEEKASDGELEGGLIEFDGIETVEEIESGLLFVAEVFEPFLFELPMLVGGAVVPI